MMTLIVWYLAIGFLWAVYLSMRGVPAIVDRRVFFLRAMFQWPLVLIVGLFYVVFAVLLGMKRD